MCSTSTCMGMGVEPLSCRAVGNWVTWCCTATCWAVGYGDMLGHGLHRRGGKHFGQSSRACRHDKKTNHRKETAGFKSGQQQAIQHNIPCTEPPQPQSSHSYSQLGCTVKHGRVRVRSRGVRVRTHQSPPLLSPWTMGGPTKAPHC